MIRGAQEIKQYLRAMGMEAPTDIRKILGREPTRLLVIGMRRIGDLIVILPAIQALRDHFPRTHITVLSGSDHEMLLRSQSYVDHFERLPDDEHEFHRRADAYDLVIAFRDWYVPPKDTATFPPYYVFSYKLLAGPPKLAHVHYLDALRLLGFKPRVRRPRLKLDRESRMYAKRFFATFEFGPKDLVVAVHPGASYAGKRWPCEHYAQVLEWLQQCYDAKFVMVQGRDGDNLVNVVTAHLKEDRIAVLGDTPLLKLTAVLARCTFYLGNDSGVMHLADAVGLPSLTIFGPSRPSVWGAAGPYSVNLVRQDIWDSCPKCSGRHLKDIPCERPDDQPCLRAIRVQDVLAALESLLALTQLRKRFKHLDAIRVTDNLMSASVGSTGQVLSNLHLMRPLFVFKEPERVQSCFDAVINYGSYDRVVQQGLAYRSLLDALLTYRIILPKSDPEKLLSNDVRQAKIQVLSHPLVNELGLCLLGLDHIHPNESNVRLSDQGIPPLREGNGSTTKRLRVLFVNSIDPSIYGGGERWMLKVGSALACRGHEVLCWGQPEHRWMADAQQQGITCLTNPVPLTLDLKEVPTIVDHLRRLHPDAALLNLDRDVNSLALPLRLAQVPVVFARKGLAGINNQPVTRWAYSRVLDGVITPSEGIRQELVKDGWLEPERIRVIPNGVDVSRFDTPVSGLDALREDLNLGPDSKVILTIGRLTYQKGMIHLMRAVPKILKRHHQARFLVVGRGPTQAKLRIKVAHSGLDGAVRFLGERWDTERLLALADCYVQPSRYEGMSSAMLEAMAARVPVVATAVYGATEVITDGVNGHIVPVGNSVALSNAICHILEDGGRNSPLANAGRDYVRFHYSFKTMIDAVEDLLYKGL